MSDRLLVEPVIVLSAPRSGSTLLRAMLGSHNALWAPHEIPLTGLRVDAPFGGVERAVRMLGWTPQDLDYLLWDRMLHASLQRAGKSTVVLKSPTDVLAWERLAGCWPDARYVVLLRHPGSILESWVDALGHDPTASATHLLQFMTALDAARAVLPCATIRYEQLVADPKAELRSVCEHLGVAFEPGMLDYGGAGPFRLGVGDTSTKIQSGRIQAGRELPAQVPDQLRPICEAWGYGVPSRASSPVTDGVSSSVPSEVS